MESHRSEHEERRRDEIAYRDFIDKRINDLEERRDKNLQQKVDALEKLVNLTFATRSEALSIAVSRIEGENKGCFSRCKQQVDVFYALINKINNDNTGRDIHYETLRSIVEEINKELAELEKFHTTDIEKTKRENVESLSECRKLIGEIQKDLIDINSWKSNFWIKNITSAIVATVFAYQVVFHGIVWLMEYIGKVKPPTP